MRRGAEPDSEGEEPSRPRGGANSERSEWRLPVYQAGNGRSLIKELALYSPD